MDVEEENTGLCLFRSSGRITHPRYLLNLLMGDFVSDWSPLHEASIHGRLHALKNLINQGASVNFRTADCVSPLHEACLGGHAACVSVLLKHGANVNATTIDWNTPLFNTCISGSVDCLNLLLQHGANPHPVCDLASPIHEAAKRGHTKCVETLLSNGVSIDHNIKHLGTPLYVACENQQLKCAKKLLESGASANSGKGLDSPLHIAAQTSNVDMVHLLIDFGANTRVINAEGKKANRPGSNQQCTNADISAERRCPLTFVSFKHRVQYVKIPRHALNGHICITLLTLTNVPECALITYNIANISTNLRPLMP